jgi:hypothetical protein
MKRPGLELMRNTAAAMMCLSGLVHIGSLWFRDISGTTLIAALFGGAYLLIGIGLYGVSRFTLSLAVLVPGIGTWLALRHIAPGNMSSLAIAQILTNIVVIVLCAAVLYRVRGNPSI